MVDIFEINENQKLNVTAQALLIPEIKEIWDRDKDIKKSVAIQELSYVEFMTSPRKHNPYREFKGDEKKKQVIKDLIKIPDWKPDEIVNKVILIIENFYEKGSQSYRYFLSVKKAIQNMEDFFNNVDLEEKNFKTGNPLYKPSDITRALNDVEKILQSFKSLEKRVQEELLESKSKIQADKVISPFANPESFK